MSKPIESLASRLASSAISTRSTTPGGSLRERDSTVQLASYTNLHVHQQSGPQLVATRGKGIYVYDEVSAEPWTRTERNRG